MKLKPILILFLLLWTQAVWADDIQVRKGTLVKKTDGYFYKLEYPISPDLPERANTNSLLFVQKMVTDFTQAYSEMLGEAGSGGLDWGLEVEVAEPYVNKNLVAYDFSGYDFRGGAHGMPILQTLLLERGDGSVIAPADLFKDDKYLEILSRYCRNDLVKRGIATADDEWMLKGSTPEVENYTVLLPGPKGITVTFVPYQVGSYAQGTQEILVPYSVLKGVLNPDFFKV